MLRHFMVSFILEKTQTVKLLLWNTALGFVSAAAQARMQFVAVNLLAGLPWLRESLGCFPWEAAFSRQQFGFWLHQTQASTPAWLEDTLKMHSVCNGLC